MATHYVLCPCCGLDHSSDSVFQERSPYTEEDSHLVGKEECRICRIGNSYRTRELRDFGKNHSDCRFLRPVRRSHYHRNISGYGDAVDFDVPAHTWNCADHSHCQHGTLGVVEERAATMLRSSSDEYNSATNNCSCRSHNRVFHMFFPNRR